MGPSNRDVQSVAATAYIYAYPSVDLYRILHNFALDPSSSEYKAPPNRFAHSRALADAANLTIIAMNVDTPYSYAWLDLRAQPMVLTVPPFGADRYVAAQLIDLYTYIVGYVSPRTNGHSGGDFLVVGPSWSAEAPGGFTGVFRSPTELLLVLVRTQLFSDEDMPTVAAIQDGFSVTPPSTLAHIPATQEAPPLAPIAPVDVRAGLSPDYFDVFGWMLEYMPELPEDADLRARMASIGIAPGARFADIEPSVREDVLAGMGAGMEAIVERTRSIRSSAEIFGNREFFAGDHLARACGAMLGILGNSADEFLSVGYQRDAHGDAFDGSRDYTIRFAPGALPPVAAFWSITVYNDRRLLHANPLNRYAIGSRQVEGLRRDADGGFTIVLSSTSPGPDLESNWLPVPSGPFTVGFRTYAPGPEIRSGKWQAPPVRPI